MSSEQRKKDVKKSGFKLKSGPVAISLLIHLFIIALAAFSFESKAPKTISTPKYIEAKLVKLETQSKKAPPKKKAKKIDLTKRQKEKAAREKAAMEAKRKAQAKKKAEAEAAQKRKALDEAKRREQEQRQQEEMRRQQMLSDLESAMQEEESALAEQQLEQEAQSYIEKISQRIEQNWSRPPSARNGMRCELLIQLVPTGRVVSVSIVKSSGNSAFDRSAEQAVKKAELFPEIKEMSPQVFERHYRRLNLIFNPQDLRQ